MIWNAALAATIGVSAAVAAPPEPATQDTATSAKLPGGTRTPAPLPVERADSKALESAFRDAVAALRRDILQAPFSADMTVGQAAGKLNATQAIDASIQSARQPGGPRWRNTICELRLELPGKELARIFAEAGRGRSGELGMTSDFFDRRLAHLQTQTFVALGFGDPKAPRQNAVPPVAEKVESIVPLNPPAWINRQLDVEGLGGGNGLKGARAAEAVALAELRRQVEALPLSGDMTLGAAIQKDPRVAGALRDAIRRARVSRVEYGNENVTVRMCLDLDYVWRALAAIK